VAIAFKQAPDPGAATASGTTLNLAFVSDVTAGGSIRVVARIGATGRTITITDSKGNTYNASPGITGDVTQAQTTDLHQAYIFSADNCAAGPTTVTTAISGAATTIRVCIAEYSGIATSGALDKTASAQADASSAPSSGATAATTQADELVFGASSSSDNQTYTAGSGYTRRASTPSNAGTARMSIEDKIVAVTGAQTADWSTGSTNWTALVATYKGAAAGGGGSMVKFPWSGENSSGSLHSQRL